MKVVEMLNDKIGNAASLELDQTNYYAAIIGESPSKGAKSPLLWNAAFQHFNVSAKMHPMDVKLKYLKEVVAGLKRDNCFIGGSVTMPHKQAIVDCLDRLEPEAKAIGAVNCIYREGGELIGANTDGAGAIASLETTIGKDRFKSSNVLLCGLGGAGLAVAVYVAGALGADQTLFLTNRNKRRSDELAQKLTSSYSIKSILWPINKCDIKNINIIINCSSIGFGDLRQDDKGAYSLKYYSPLCDFDAELRVSNNVESEENYYELAKESINKNLLQTRELLEAMNKPFIFDIIYQPLETPLLSIAKEVGLETLNGAKMNLEQAVIAFTKTAQASDLIDGNVDSIRSSMQKVW